ncbi:unnamed protein product [Vitrella brassicaformis CCMP3155]|uniref:Jacalin-type lectin domain-containing protein n=1 Tax=Vitrella brassicaformis (strain CCMP3155) TaxID=1169540 RepID=A0A0G4EY63_VITBC|nr:unnamed protein product [Vitrella brassicaformis CCMP3155]|eukprot:CEM03569.1 unnamed protein product [Vitrella brassicaformis CCMP3155]
MTFRSYSDGHMTFTFGGSGGGAFDDRATLIQRHADREVNEWRLSAIRVTPWTHALARISSTYVSVVDGERVTLTHGFEGPGTLHMHLHSSETLTLQPGEYISYVQGSSNTIPPGPGGAGNRCAKVLRITTNRPNGIGWNALWPYGGERHEWSFECDGGEGVVPRHVIGRSGESIDSIGFHCDKPVPDVLPENFTPAHFAALPKRVRRQIAAFFSVCHGANASRHTLPACTLRAVTALAFPAFTGLADEDEEEEDGNEEDDAGDGGGDESAGDDDDEMDVDDCGEEEEEEMGDGGGADEEDGGKDGGAAAAGGSGDGDHDDEDKDEESEEASQ